MIGARNGGVIAVFVAPRDQLHAKAYDFRISAYDLIRRARIFEPFDKLQRARANEDAKASLGLPQRQIAAVRQTANHRQILRNEIFRRRVTGRQAAVYDRSLLKIRAR